MDNFETTPLWNDFVEERGTPESIQAKIEKAEAIARAYGRLQAKADDGALLSLLKD